MTSSAWVLARRGPCGPCIALMTKKVEEGLRRGGDFMHWRASSAPRRALSLLHALNLSELRGGRECGESAHMGRRESALPK